MQKEKKKVDLGLMFPVFEKREDKNLTEKEDLEKREVRKIYPSKVCKTESAKRAFRYFLNFEGDLYFNSPTAEAYQSEVELIETIFLHSEGEIEDEEFREACDRFLETHDRNLNHNSDWAEGVPLFSVSNKLDPQENFVCNELQFRIIEGIKKMKGEKLTPVIKKL